MIRHPVMSAVPAAISLVTGLRLAGDAAARPVTVSYLLAATSATDWRRPDPDNTLYLELSSGRVIIELAPRIAPRHVANIKALARALLRWSRHPEGAGQLRRAVGRSRHAPA